MLYTEKNKVETTVCQVGQIVGEEGNGSIRHIQFRTVLMPSGKIVDEGKARILATLLEILDVDDNSVPTNARLSREGTWIVPKSATLSTEGFGLNRK